ncbi:MAG: putative Na+/H+ antiporter [Verrucomicrobiota bacterium]
MAIFRNVSLLALTFLVLFQFTNLTQASVRGAEADFPVKLSDYKDSEVKNIWTKLKGRIDKAPFNLIASIIFLCAILHTFMASKFMAIAHKIEHKHKKKLAEQKNRDGKEKVSFKATLFHFLGEIEAIFGIWVVPLAVIIVVMHGGGVMEHYIGETVNYREPIFVVVIMTIAASRPVMFFAEKCISFIAALGKGTPLAYWLSILTIAPLLGSFITEPAAISIGALLLSQKFYELNPSNKLKYATIGLLFVNISIGGTLTNFAAPPVLMVATAWDWSTPFMAAHFGWKALAAILISNTLYFVVFAKEFKTMAVETVEVDGSKDARAKSIPLWIVVVHLLFMAYTVSFAHFSPLCIGGFLFYIAFTYATQHHQNDSINLKPALLVGFFLAGLEIHGGCQTWWIEPVLSVLNAWPLMIGSTALTAFNDNAAITYLASLVPSFTDEMKYAVVAGAVTGGGLTVIANAPNPAGQSILSKHFANRSVSPFYLALSALIPTIIAGACFMLLPHIPIPEGF